MLNAHLSSNTLQLGRIACQAKQDALFREFKFSRGGGGGVASCALKTNH